MKQRSLNNNDCLTCAFTNLLRVSYKCIYKSIVITSTGLNSLPDKLFNCTKLPLWRLKLTNKNLVLIFTFPHYPHKTAHAVAVINGKCVDNDTNSRLENLSIKEIIKLGAKPLCVYTHN